MRPMLKRLLEEAGLADVAQRALQGGGLLESDLERLRSADFLLVAGMADLVRAKFHGNEVRIVPSNQLREPNTTVAEAAPALDKGPTGADFLTDLALLRLKTPGERGVAVSFDSVGLELAQTALVFGANVLFGELAGRRTLPLLEGPTARRTEITGLCERAGRSVRFNDENVAQPQAEQRS